MKEIINSIDFRIFSKYGYHFTVDQNIIFSGVSKLIIVKILLVTIIIIAAILIYRYYTPYNIM